MYNPSLHTATNKPIGITGKPVDARTYFYDSATFTYRPYASVAEALGYLIGNDRLGHFSLIIGTYEYWFKDGIADGNLIIKSNVQTSVYPVAVGTQLLDTGGGNWVYRIPNIFGTTTIGTEVRAGKEKIFIQDSLDATNIDFPLPDIDGTGKTTRAYTITISYIALSSSATGMRFKTVATYNDMTLDGTPTVATVYEVIDDENKPNTRSTYLWKPNGNREWLASYPDN